MSTGDPSPSAGGLSLRAALLLAAAPFFWSGNFVIGRATSSRLPPITAAYWRWQLALLLLLPLAGMGLWRARATLRVHWRQLSLLALLGVAGFNTFVYLGLQTTSATKALLINSAIPLFILPLSRWWLGVPVGRPQMLGVLLSLAGVGYLVAEGELSRLLALEFNPGDLWILVAAFSWAAYSVLVRDWRPKQLEGDVFLLATVVIGLLPLALLHWTGVSGEPAVDWGPVEMASVLYFALFASVIAFICWNAGIALVGAARGGPFIHLMPAFGIALAFVWLGEPFHAFHLVGVLLVGGGVWLSLRD